jgi:hypothetical protein
VTPDQDDLLARRLVITFEQYGNLEVYRLVDGRVLGPPEEPEEEEEEVGSDAEAT